VARLLLVGFLNVVSCRFGIQHGSSLSFPP